MPKPIIHIPADQPDQPARRKSLAEMRQEAAGAEGNECPRCGCRDFRRGCCRNCGREVRGA